MGQEQYPIHLVLLKGKVLNIELSIHLNRAVQQESLKYGKIGLLDIPSLGEVRADLAAAHKASSLGRTGLLFMSLSRFCYISDTPLSFQAELRFKACMARAFAVGLVPHNSVIMQLDTARRRENVCQFSSKPSGIVLIKNLCCQM